MAPEAHNLEVFFFPFMAPGHMIPAVDMARLFASRGVMATVVTTRGNASFVQPAVDRANNSGTGRMRLLLMPFPSSEAGLPEGCENVASVPAELQQKFFASTALLRYPLERLIGEHRPDCIISDLFFPWTADVALAFEIPRIVFGGTSFFSNCVTHGLGHHARPAEGETASFVVPGLPHRIELLRTQTPDLSAMPEMMDLLRRLEESELRSFGMVVNSFYELEPEYADHYRQALGRKAWHVGPVSLCGEVDAADEGATRGAESSIDVADCLSWLDGKKPNSVVYVSFGSMSLSTGVQLREIALALEASNHPFIWVVRNVVTGAGDEEEWLPEGFLDKVSENNSGLVIRGWAPQVVILNHGAVGAFVTHCGWNSCLEAITAGVPLVTWPLSAEQFYNERQVTEVLQVGTAVGARAWTWRAEERELIKAEQIEEAVSRVIGGGEEAEGMRRRAGELARRARRAMEEGGSSYSDMDRLISELIEERRRWSVNQSVEGKHARRPHGSG